MMSVLGEINKVVPLSPQRFLSMNATADDFTMEVRGALNETVEVSFAVGIKGLFTIPCKFTKPGVAMLSLGQGKCQ